MREEVEINEKCAFVRFGRRKDKAQFKLWIVEEEFLEKEGEKYYIKFPVRNAQVQMINKETLVLKKEEGVVFNIRILPLQKRGRSTIIKVLPLEEVLVFPYEEDNHDFQIEGALINAPVGILVKVFWEKKEFSSRGEEVSLRGISFLSEE